MKNLLKLTLISTLLIVASCNAPVNSNPDFETNVELAKSFMIAHGADDIATQTDLLHDDLLWQPPMYGSEQYGKTEHIEAMKMYQSMFDDILYTADNWLPGVNAETGELDGSVRTYGHWSGTHSISGKSFKGLWYHYLTFDANGKIIEGGDFGDATGLVMSVMPTEE